MSDTQPPPEFLVLQAALADRYSIERALGAGGMATVYLAHDQRHDRQVAVKVLRPELAAVIGAQRFLQEIKTTANLQHPHILGLIDSGAADGLLWYVMPFVRGESLRDRLHADKQLPIAEAVRLAGEVASALDYAHRQGVIHRDIKPENILLHDGHALVADFGIALAASKAGGTRMTETGMSIGTPQYMSPEQAMGEREITARSDVYSLGSVTYEMLVGAPPFTGPTAQAIVARVLTGEPEPPRASRKTIPPHVEAAVLQALEKLPADRFASAAEFATALGNPAFTSTRSSVELRRAPVPVAARAWLPWALFLAALGFIGFDQLRPRAASPGAPVQRFDILLPDHAAYAGNILSVMALSPDGTLLAYNGEDSTGHRRLYLRALDRAEPVPVAGSDNGRYPFFSPDGRWLGFRVGTRIVRTPVAGGSPETICESHGAAIATWMENNAIVIADSLGLRECVPGGRMTTLLESGPAEVYNFPHALPGDRGILFTIQRDSASELAVLDVPARTMTPLRIAGSDPRYVDTGHLVYAGPDGLVRAVPFDVRRRAPSGEPGIIPEPVLVDFGVAQMAVSRNGIIVRAPSLTSPRTLELVDRSGRAERYHPRIGTYADPRFSPDGRQVALVMDESIWLLDRAQGALTRLSPDSGARRPAWSPDGKRVGYVLERGRTTDVRVTSAEGGGTAVSIPGARRLEPWEVVFTPDGRSALLRTVAPSGSRDIWLVALDSTRPPVPLLQNPANEVAPALSPDGRWLAYVSTESGRAEVYVQSFPKMAARVPVSLDGGTEPVWSPRGDELFYRSGPALLAATVRPGPVFGVLRRTLLFSDRNYLADLTHQVYDVAPDGRHFLMVRNQGGTSHLTVTLNQFRNLGAAPSP
ncbi:MAG TPA: protein kinase [Gemmatimonadales bacterium]|nr:protein kinase [Gemmatimonadales bacterium]